MKIKTFLRSRPQAAAPLLLGLALLVPPPAAAQNFVRNPDFEEPLGPDNWTVEYAAVTGGNVIAANRPTNCGPNDFLIKGRTCIAHRNLGVPSSGTWDGAPTYWNKFGAHLMPNHTWVCHAYFKQVVTNLTPGASYTISAWMTQFGKTTKADVYLEALGGLGARRTVSVVNDAKNNPAGWQPYAVTNTADANGQIEVRLHMNKNMTDVSSLWSYREINAFFDHVAVMPEGQTESPMPEYQIVAFARSNQDLTLTWETLMNNRYRLQYSTNLSDPAAWAWVERSPYLDTNFFATGPTFTFQTNLASLFAFNPAVDLEAPLFFRIHSTSFKP
jgi:hypothetical protein